MSNKIALDALTKFVKNAEQSVFEDWLEAKSPSGDVEQVQIQWEGSSEYREFCERWVEARTAVAALEAGGWLPIETCPETGFFLVHKDGAIRTMFRFEGKWDHADPPILIDQWGDSMVSNEVEKHYPGKKLGISGGILEPTHYQPLPTPPKD